ncbi:hypothetical protein HDV64DRAFT_110666 [Trichoderma sp. TUCIM 5745]
MPQTMLLPHTYPQGAIPQSEAWSTIGDEMMFHRQLVSRCSLCHVTHCGTPCVRDPYIHRDPSHTSQTQKRQKDWPKRIRSDFMPYLPIYEKSVPVPSFLSRIFHYNPLIPVIIHPEISPNNPLSTPEYQSIQPVVHPNVQSINHLNSLPISIPISVSIPFLLPFPMSVPCPSSFPSSPVSILEIPQSHSQRKKKKRKKRDGRKEGKKGKKKKKKRKKKKKEIADTAE